jgi:hypothetical protein
MLRTLQIPSSPPEKTTGGIGILATLAPTAFFSGSGAGLDAQEWWEMRVESLVSSGRA